MIYWQLFVSMLKIAALSFGGGPASLPVIKHECVEKRGWITEEEFAEIILVMNTIPGPIYNKIVAYIGYKVLGWVGFYIAIFIVSVPTALLFVLLLGYLHDNADNPYVVGVRKAVPLVIISLFIYQAVDFFKFSVRANGIYATVFFGGLLIFFLLAEIMTSAGLILLILSGSFLLSGGIRDVLKLILKKNKVERNIPNKLLDKEKETDKDD